MSRKVYKIVTRESMDVMLSKDGPQYVQAVIGRALVAILMPTNCDRETSK